jgi:hypothetical protein
VFGIWPGVVVHPHTIGVAVLATVALVFCCSCNERYAYTSGYGSLAEGRDGHSSIRFDMNRRPIRLELYMRLDGSSALVELDHPDGRTTDVIEVAGPGIRQIEKEIPKEPGSWSVCLTAQAGSTRYWLALHDRRKFIGPDDTAKHFIEGK